MTKADREHLLQGTWLIPASGWDEAETVEHEQMEIREAEQAAGAESAFTVNDASPQHYKMDDVRARRVVRHDLRILTDTGVSGNSDNTPAKLRVTEKGIRIPQQETLTVCGDFVLRTGEIPREAPAFVEFQGPEFQPPETEFTTPTAGFPSPEEEFQTPEIDFAWLEEPLQPRPVLVKTVEARVRGPGATVFGQIHERVNQAGAAFAESAAEFAATAAPEIPEIQEISKIPERYSVSGMIGDYRNVPGLDGDCYRLAQPARTREIRRDKWVSMQGVVDVSGVTPLRFA